MNKVLSELVRLMIKKLHKKKQPSVKAVNSIVIIINLNKD